MFNPIYFDADEWIRLAKDCGMKYFVITSKHHDGFAMFHSRVDKYNVVDATPFGRDVVGELANACARHGLKFGLYYSQDLDWHDPNGGGYLSNHIPCAGKTWDNSWDFPDEKAKNFDLCFENKMMPQIEEILKNYGELCLVWFDVPMTIRPEQSRRIYEAVKRYQPNCLINSRLGNGAYDYVSLGDNEIPDHIPESDEAARADMNAINGFKPSPYGLYESAATLNDTWGFSGDMTRIGKAPIRSSNTAAGLESWASTTCSTSAPILWPHSRAERGNPARGGKKDESIKNKLPPSSGRRRFSIRIPENIHPSVPPSAGRMRKKRLSSEGGGETPSFSRKKGSPAKNHFISLLRKHLGR